MIERPIRRVGPFVLGRVFVHTGVDAPSVRRCMHAAASSRAWWRTG